MSLEKPSIVLPEIVDESFVARWEPATEADAYHADNSAVNAGLLRAYKTSPSTCAAQLAGLYRKEQTPAMLLGTAVHALVLPDDKAQPVVGQPEGMRKGTKAFDEWQKGVKPGSIILSADAFDRARRMADAVRAHPEAAAILVEGVAERVGYFRDPVTGAKCRIKPDWYVPGEEWVIDLKSYSGVLAESELVDRTILNYDYHMAISHYALGLESIQKTMLKNRGWIFVESSFEYEPTCQVIFADQAMVERGDELREHYLKKLMAACAAVRDGAPLDRAFPRTSHKWRVASLPGWGFKPLDEQE